MGRRIGRHFAFFLLLFLSTPSPAYEVDNFTGREALTKDALSPLNAEIERILASAERNHNRQSPRFCSKALLRQEILRWIRPDPVGMLEIWAATTDQIQQIRITRKESVYGGVNFLDSPMLWTVGIGKSMRVAGHVIGTDKLGHFFMQGLEYYDLAMDGKPLDQILKEDHKEDGVWGLDTSGVFSYADMAANYQGYRFWNSLTFGERPYFQCVPKVGWMKVRTFDWSEYVSDAWDEGINCSEMRPRVAKKFEDALHERGQTCPTKPEKCVEVTKLERSGFFTSPRCKSAALTELARPHTHASR